MMRMGGIEINVKAQSAVEMFGSFQLAEAVNLA
jgi:hypothetical protein